MKLNENWPKKGSWLKPFDETQNPVLPKDKQWVLASNWVIAGLIALTALALQVAQHPLAGKAINAAIFSSTVPVLFEWLMGRKALAADGLLLVVILLLVILVAWP